MKDRNPNPILTMIKTEWQYLGRNKNKFLLYMFLFVVAGLLSLISPWLIGTIFNSIQNGKVSTRPELLHLFFMISLLFFIELGFWIFYGTARIYQQLIGFQTYKNYTNDKVRKVLGLPMKWHKDNHSGNTIDRINKARLALSSYAEHESYEIVFTSLKIFGSLGLIFFINVKIGLFALISCTAILLISMSLDKKVKSNYKKFNKYEHQLSASIFDYFSNIMTVVTLRIKDIIEKKIDGKIEAGYVPFRKASTLLTTKWGLAKLAISIMTVLALIYQSYTDFHTTGVILIGTLFMLYSYLEKVGSAFFKLAQFYGLMTRRATDIESVRPIDDAFNKIKNKISKQLPKHWKQIDIKDLSFKYNENGNSQHINNISLSFKRGEKIALIGESGSGKSTILTLLRGLYLPQKAKIYCDDKLLKYGIQTLKQSVTLIPQDPEIFNETIRYNITMGTSYSTRKIKDAIEMAQFSSVVAQLEKGIDANVLEKGVSLSGGEKQRLALSRGVLASINSDIVLLDEPTSSVDSINERKIHENIFKEFKNKTIISSIHRLHLLNKFDYIYIFDKGKIVGKGTFKELQTNQLFKNIWKRYLGNQKK